MATVSVPAPTKPSAKRLLTPALLLATGIVVVVAAGSGAFHIAAGDVVASITHRLGLASTTPLNEMAESVLWEIRFPRIAMTFTIGAALGCAGALTQGAFANPLAEPGIIGVSAGAALGAVTSIALGFTFFGSLTTTAFAFIGGLAVAFCVYLTSRTGSRVEVVTLVLTGVALNAMCGAGIGLMMFLSDEAELRTITFWTLGSTAGATWASVSVLAPLTLAGTIAALLLSRQLDLLALGEREAGHLGVSTGRLRGLVVLIVALLTAAAVAVSGVINFIGLVVPHVVRMIMGPAHRGVLVGSALLGGVGLLAADLGARTLASPAEIPLGVLTALIGSPFFLLLIRRTRERQGGWA